MTNESCSELAQTVDMVCVHTSARTGSFILVRTLTWHLSFARLAGSTGFTMSSALYLYRLQAGMPTLSLLRGP
jgi:hypothetical protein